MTSKSTFRLTFVALAAGASLSAFAQYSPNIQQNFQPSPNSGFQDWQNGASGVAAAQAATAAAYQNPAAQFLQSSAPASGFTNDGTLMMGGQKIGNPHQILHDAEIPSFMTITANRYTYTNNPNHGQGTLTQMEQATTVGSDGTVLINRLYLSPTNPYSATASSPYPNYQTYQSVLANAQVTGYKLAVADDGKTYAIKTLTAATTQAQNILVKELPNTAQFRAAADPAGGGVGVRVTQNGDAAALAAYMATVKPYDFSWQQGFGEYGNNWNNAVQSNNFNSFVNSPKFDNKSWEDFLANGLPRNWAFIKAGQYFGESSGGSAFFATDFNNAEQTDLYEKIWGSVLKRVAPPVVVYYTGSTILNKQTPEQQLETARQLQASWNQTVDGVKSWWNNLTESRGGGYFDGGLGTNRPKDAPPGTLGIDKWGPNHGWDSDRLHGEKEDATGGGKHGEAWVGVAPNGDVGVNRGNRWNVEGKVDPKEGQKEAGDGKSDSGGDSGSSDSSSNSGSSGT